MTFSNAHRMLVQVQSLLKHAREMEPQTIIYIANFLDNSGIWEELRQVERLETSVIVSARLESQTLRDVARASFKSRVPCPVCLIRELLQVPAVKGAGRRLANRKAPQQTNECHH